MVDRSYGPKVYREQGGDRQVVKSGGSLDVESGGEIDIESGAAFKIAGTDRAAAMATAPAAIAAGYKIARGQLTTVSADDTVVTGLATVVAAVASLEADPVAGAQFVTCVIGNQSGAPAAGSIQIKSWKATATADTAQIPATTFAKKVNWIAIGT